MRDTHPAGPGRSAGKFAASIAGALLLIGALGTPASAQTPGSGLASSYSANANKPIDIEADSLEVDDKKKVAVFKGNVLATQGDFHLRAIELQVTYNNGAPKEKDKTSPQPANAGSIVPGSGSEITRIDAKGKVLVTTKDNQTATSDWAIFEAKKQLVTLGGEVILSQGANTIKGDRLVIDLTSGLSRFENSEGGPKERLRAIFTPKSNPKVPGAAK
jgi:lipopolysaccharide export system protein LptA